MLRDQWKKGKGRSFEELNFHVTTGNNFICVDEPGVVSMGKHFRITHFKTTAQKGFI